MRSSRKNMICDYNKKLVKFKIKSLIIQKGNFWHLWVYNKTSVVDSIFRIRIQACHIFLTRIRIQILPRLKLTDTQTSKPLLQKLWTLHFNIKKWYFRTFWAQLCGKFHKNTHKIAHLEGITVLQRKIVKLEWVEVKGGCTRNFLPKMNALFIKNKF